MNPRKPSVRDEDGAMAEIRRARQVLDFVETRTKGVKCRERLRLIPPSVELARLALGKALMFAAVGNVVPCAGGVA